MCSSFICIRGLRVLYLKCIHLTEVEFGTANTIRHFYAIKSQYFLIAYFIVP